MVLEYCLWTLIYESVKMNNDDQQRRLSENLQKLVQELLSDAPESTK